MSPGTRRVTQTTPGVSEATTAAGTDHSGRIHVHEDWRAGSEAALPFDEPAPVAAGGPARRVAACRLLLEPPWLGRDRWGRDQ